MSNMSSLTGLIIAKLVCCGALILLAGTGALVGLGGWLTENIWLVAAAIGLGVGALLLHLRSRVPIDRQSTAEPGGVTGEETALRTRTTMASQHLDKVNGR